MDITWSDFEPILIALANSATSILTALSKFDITKLDNSNVIVVSQFIVDTIRFVKLFF